MNKIFLAFCIVVSTTSHIFCQDAKGLKAVEDFIIPESSIVSQHKDVVRLTLIVDSIQRGDTIYKRFSNRTLQIKNESEYLNVANDIYLKIFVTRNEEYGKKFYAWKWNILRKEGSNYLLLNFGQYDVVDVRTDFLSIGNSYSLSTDDYGLNDFLTIFCRYKFD